MAERIEHRTRGEMEFNDLSDEELMERVQQGERTAFAQLVERHTPRFYRLAYRMMTTQEAAEDIVQSAFLKIWQDPGKWERARNAKFTTWFYRVVVNLCLDAQKKKKAEPWDGEWPASRDDPNEAQIIAHDQHRWLARSLKQLPPRQQAALNLCFYEGLSHREAAAVLGIRVKALESLVVRAKQNLKIKAQELIPEVI